MDLFRDCVYRDCEKETYLRIQMEVILEHSFEKSQARNDGFSAVYAVSLEHLEFLDILKLLEWKRYMISVKLDIHWIIYIN